MDSIMKSEIFFVIASVGIVIVTIGISIALFYIIKLLRTVDAVSDDVKEHVASFGSWVRGNALTRRLFSPARKTRKPKASAPDEE